MIYRYVSFVAYFFLVAALCVFHPAKAQDGSPSFSEWRDTTERAFRNWRAQEDKLLDADSARVLIWERGLRSSALPENETIEHERRRDPKTVAAVEACRTALMTGAVLRLKVLGRLQPGRDNPLNVDGDVGVAQYARLYIGFAETCEDGLHLLRPANAFRARYR